ncbi:protein arginine methyltransferase [Heterostelium album PN500]|uniref:Protein arginine N-methyltransferase n=1 Tax=Heterostelium pallidum (strain ATCC 26659 / Pp 5 / PN500) TaxID=670386 RepID=D3AZB0_HETP5|nr:protein arginine methyltransferase [Heterostelium album PN500]EFA85493.1 protein arginine methyltransferase [Heterostelium album PN500]|eukprot:XP_020437601.1 protein arginine methyltransferase [Heterostelium album PN500]
MNGYGTDIDENGGYGTQSGILKIAFNLRRFLEQHWLNLTAVCFVHFTLMSSMNNNNNNNLNREHYPFSCGIEYNDVCDLRNEVDNAYDTGFDFLAVPIAHPRNKRDIRLDQPFTRSDLLLESSQWKSVIVAKLSPWLHVDSLDITIRKTSIDAMKQEISWAAHLAVPALMIPTPTKSISPFYAQIINQTLSSLTNMRLWMRIPLTTPELSLDRSESVADETNNDNSSVAPVNTWCIWNDFRTLCNQHPSLFVVLEMTADLPSPSVINQWLGEPVKAIIIPTSIFVTNPNGYPSLIQKHREFLRKIFKYNIQFILSGCAENMQDYLKYIKYLHENQEPITEVEYFEQPYLDYLQMPLQPLMDNLESQTYEIFERDPVKYLEYKNAIRKALLATTTPDSLTTVMVVGAGRGPLIKSAITASLEASRKIRVFAVEKNPNAIVTLRNRIVMEGWQEIVTIIECDMRYWQTEERADIMVSELLGSFGDNELSPECLDGAQRFLKPNGISIPTWYTSYIAPMSSSKLYNEVASHTSLKHFETPYVVKAHNFHQIATSKPLFTFTHPNPEVTKTIGEQKHSLQPIVIDNDRFETIDFSVENDTMLHGFIGYFDCCLYDDVHISINPANFSTGMFSWFPIYFPIKEPINIQKGNKITLQFWRNSNRSKVWYEWTVTSPLVAPIHNTGGRSYWIGL